MVKGKKSKMEESNGSSPPKKKVKGGGRKKAEDIDRIVGGMPGPGKKSTIIDTGGCGDCGWRALSFSVGAHNAAGGTTDEDLVDRLDIISKTMQAKVTTYVITIRRSGQMHGVLTQTPLNRWKTGRLPKTLKNFAMPFVEGNVGSAAW